LASGCVKMPVETGLLKKNLRDLAERAASLRGFL
jgi:hypothetical protein